MRTITMAGIFLLATATAALGVKPDGTDISYRSTAQVTIDGQPVKLRWTGGGVREKAWVNVYAIGGFLAEGVKVSGARGFASVDAPKMLHLVMEREVSGSKMANAFEEAIRANYKSGFGGEISKLKGFLKSKAASKGEHIKFIHRPGKGLKVQRRGKSIEIDGVKFSTAVWDIYLGSENVGSDIKKGLVKRLRPTPTRSGRVG